MKAALDALRAPKRPPDEADAPDLYDVPEAWQHEAATGAVGLVPVTFCTPTDYPHVWRSAVACLAVEAWACVGYYLLVTRLVPRLV